MKYDQGKMQEFDVGTVQTEKSQLTVFAWNWGVRFQYRADIFHLYLIHNFFFS